MKNDIDYIANLMNVRQSIKDFSLYIKSRGFVPGSIIDVGVAFGSPDIYCLSDKATLVLIEPVIEFREYLAAIKASRKGDTFVHYGAAALADGELELWVTPDMTTSSLLVPMNATRHIQQRTVRCWKLDTLQQQDNWPTPYLLKVDVQGAELDVLQGAGAVLEHTEVIILEVSFFPFAPGLPDFTEVIHHMKKLGFVAYDMFNGHNRPLDGARGQIDIAFVKENGFFRKDFRWGTEEQCKKFLDCKFNSQIRKMPYQRLNPSHASPEQFSQMLELCLSDDREGRLTPAGRLILAEAYAYNGMLEEAESEVSIAYRENISLVDGYVRIARICCNVYKSYERSLYFCEKDMALERLTDSGRLFLAKIQLLLGIDQKALANLLSIRTIPPEGWTKIAELLAHSLYGAISSHSYNEQSPSTIMTNHEDLAYTKCLGAEKIFEIIADMAITSERVVRMSKLGQIDFFSQIRTIASKINIKDQIVEPVPFLNSKIYYPSAKNLLEIYEKIVLHDPKYFEMARECPFIIDGNANYGASIAFFKWLYPCACIIAFEPNPTLFEICKRNIELNEWNDVTLYPYALFNERIQMPLYCDQDTNMSSSFRSRSEKKGRTFKNLIVECRTLGDLIDGQVDFLKLNIKGAKCAAVPLISKYLPKILSGFIEYHHSSQESSLSKIIQAIEQSGHSYIIKEPFRIHHKTGVEQITSSWSRSIFFKKSKNV